MSANGRVLGVPFTASWKALSISSRESASTIVPPCTCGSNSGWLAKVGSRSSARLIFTVPLRERQRSMSSTKSAGRSARSSSCRNEIFGCAVVITVGAAISVPSASTTPVTAPARVLMRATAASVRMSTPNERAAAASAWVTPPMPPRGKPHAPMCPSPMSPTWWWAMTYAVPGLRGPAQVPMTPLTESTPFMASDSKWSSTMSAMLSVISRVRSTARRVSTSFRRRSSSAWRARSPGLRDPSLGGMSDSSGPEDRGQPVQPVVPAVDGSGVLGAELGDLLAAGGLVVGQLQVPAVLARCEVRALRVHVVAVADQVEVAHQRRRQQRHDVREARQRVVGPEGLLADGGAADDVATFEHDACAGRPWPGRRQPPARCARPRRSPRRSAAPPGHLVPFCGAPPRRRAY